MKFIRYLVLMAIMAFVFLASGQIKFSFGPELGVNSSGLTYHYPVTARQDFAKEIDRPIISPLGGIWGKLNLRHKLFLNIGVQYYKFGNKNSYIVEGPYLTESDPESTYKINDRDILTFQKIALPISIGRQIKIHKYNGSVFLGIRKNFLTQANHYSKYHRINVLNSETEVQEWQVNSNLLDKNEYLGLKRFYQGAFIGFGIDITARLNMNFSVSADQPITFYTKWSCYIEGYRKPDFAVSVKYNLKKK